MLFLFSGRKSIFLPKQLCGFGANWRWLDKLSSVDFCPLRLGDSVRAKLKSSFSCSWCGKMIFSWKKEKKITAWEVLWINKTLARQIVFCWLLSNRSQGQCVRAKLKSKIENCSRWGKWYSVEKRIIQQMKFYEAFEYMHKTQNDIVDKTNICLLVFGHSDSQCKTQYRDWR